MSGMAFLLVKAGSNELLLSRVPFWYVTLESLVARLRELKAKSFASFSLGFWFAEVGTEESFSLGLTDKLASSIG